MINMENYNIVNTYATIFAAIGTISAVIVSLYFAYSSRKISLKVSANIFIGTEDNQEYILIRIINDGYRNVKISQFIAWQFGMFRKTNVMVGEKYISNQLDALPSVLYEGEEKVIILGVEQENGENYFENLFNDFMKK